MLISGTESDLAKPLRSRGCVKTEVSKITNRIKHNIITAIRAIFFFCKIPMPHTSIAKHQRISIGVSKTVNLVCINGSSNGITSRYL